MKSTLVFQSCFVN